MVVIQNATIELEFGASAETAEQTVKQALELLALETPRRHGKVGRLLLPSVEVPRGASSLEAADTLAAALSKSLGASGAEERDA